MTAKADDSTAETQEADVTSGATPLNGRLTPVWVSLALAVLLVGALVTLFLTWRSLGHKDDLETAGRQAERAARVAAVRMTTYDYTTVKKDFSWIDDAGTAKFRSFFLEQSEPLQKYIVEVKAHASGKVIDSAAEVEDTAHVRVVLFVDQSLSTESQQEPKVDQPRLSMFMVKKGDNWLVDKIDLNNLVASN